MEYLQQIKHLKRRLESAMRLRIFRNASIPRGTDMYIDLQDVVKAEDVTTVFDIGANLGQSALKYAQHFPKATIYSFEPVSATYRELVAATARMARIRPYQLAMGNEAGRAVIHVDPQTFGSSMVHSIGETTENVDVTTASEFAQDNAISMIDLMKIDTEGFDLDVLAGAEELLRTQRIRFVMAECEPLAVTNYFVSFSALATFFEKLPYKLFGIYRQQPHWDGKKSVLYFNALFICDELVGS